MSETRAVALVTGASSGIGAAYADRLAARGFDLILVARRADRLEALAERLRQTHGRTVEIEPADLGEAADLARIEALVRTRDDVEILVNNAGVGALGPSASPDVAAVDALVRVNVLALTRLSLAASPRFAKADRGTIINIGSVIGVIPSPGGAAYSGSKAYVLNFSRSLQMEFAKSSVKVQAVMPGPVRTEFFGDRPAPFAEHQFMTAETLVDAALAGLDHGELVCFPTLHEPQEWAAFEDARRSLAKAVTTTGEPAARYGVGA